MIDTSMTQAAADYAVVEAAIRFLEANWQQQPALADVAVHVGLSPHHFQRLFTRWAGISPKRFLQYLTAQHAKQLLHEAESVLETAHAAGLSGPGRLHDLFVTVEAMTPGEYKQQGAGLAIAYGFHPTPFGEALLACTERGICGFGFVEGADRDSALAALRENWPAAALRPDEATTAPLVAQIFAPNSERPLPVLLKGTNFQIQVWQALLRIPPGTAVSYSTIAQIIGKPKAVRAVGSANGRNPIGYLIPCHRVIRSVGGFGEYRWGSSRKKAILAWESAQREQTAV